jgi:hypothetical protein
MDDNVAPGLSSPMKIGSPSGLLSIPIAVGIIFIGVREFLDPSAGALGYGVPLADPRDGDLLAIKAVRDVVSGIVVFTLLWLGDRRALAYVIGAFTLSPILDGLVVLRHAGWVFTPVILIHWGTAAVMLVTVALLMRGK